MSNLTILRKIITAHARKNQRVAAYPRQKQVAPRRDLLDPKVREDINEDLVRGGFGGKGRWLKPGSALANAFSILANHGLEPDEIVNSWLFQRPSGRTTVNLAFTNPEDSFSPTSINNSMLDFSWHDMGGNRFEVIAYVS